MERNDAQSRKGKGPWHTTLREGQGVAIACSDCVLCKDVVEVHFVGPYQVQLWIRGRGKYQPLNVDQVAKIRQNTEKEDRQPGRHDRET